MPGKSPGASIKNPATYEALKKRGYSKAKAAAISNAQSEDAKDQLPPAAQKLTGKKKQAYTAASNKAKRKGLHPKLAHRAGMKAASAVQAANGDAWKDAALEKQAFHLSEASKHLSAAQGAEDDKQDDLATSHMAAAQAHQMAAGMWGEVAANERAVPVSNAVAKSYSKAAKEASARTQDQEGTVGHVNQEQAWWSQTPAGGYPSESYKEGDPCMIDGAAGTLRQQGGSLVCVASPAPGPDNISGDSKPTGDDSYVMAVPSGTYPWGAYPEGMECVLPSGALGRLVKEGTMLVCRAFNAAPDETGGQVEVDGFSDQDEDTEDDDDNGETEDGWFGDREFTAEKRKELENKGHAMAGGAFPIETKGDLANARQALGRAKNRAATIAHIRKRAKALGVKLPPNWPNDAATLGPNDPDTDEHTLSPGEKISEKAKARRKARGRHPDDGFSDGVTLYDSHVVKDGEHYSVTDTIVLDRSSVHRRGDGYVAAHPRVARTGIQLYRGDELGSLADTVRVYRPAAAVFNRDSMSTFSTRPITSDHPPEMVDARNWKQYAVGYTGEDVARDGEYIRVPMTLCDAQTIQEFDAGKRELSVGYSCDLDWTGGVTDAGEKYDAAQRDIKVNHIAFVARARGGSNLTFGDTNGKGDDAMLNLRTIAVDGKPVQVPETAAEQILRTLAMQDALIKKLRDKKKKDDDEDDDDDTDDSKTVDAANATIATLTKQLGDLREEIVKLSSPQQRDADMREYMDAVTKAKQVLGDDIKIDPKSTAADIKKLVVAAKMGDEAAKWSVDAIDASFRTLTSTPTVGAGYRDTAAFISGGLQNGNRPGFADTRGMSPSDKAYYEMVDGMQNAWRGENWGKDTR